ncbi:hypothetical protein NP493_240g06001 [Ridgeia piscesae]|uniref:G-protein coupled receptors family 1 profile domain-containing protein n=1 Tax=Ridgeia piscesae TaxID=27915 RepID=A0AAD9NZG0_RIDPI|nr:hypothetical protein NP493_240g06001 [Ridgeia piscesae]
MADLNGSGVEYVAVDHLWANQSLTNVTDYGHSGVTPLTMVFATLYGLICAAGLLGNGLVIFVVLRYTKMKTVTNMYILNLAVADLCFLIGLPFLIATAVLRTWVFGYALCKLFYIQTSINWFTSVFTLTVMSADRYMAVCHPVRSISYRTPFVSRVVCACVWTLSLLAMLPIILYATTQTGGGATSCTIVWPDGQPITADKAFIWYALLLGFAVPVALICVFYALVLLRLKTAGPTRRSKEKRRSHRRVTKMVLTVIAVYVICWLPYWVFQVALTFADPSDVPRWSIQLFQVITVMSYANSVLNPLLYAFLSDNFRKSFIKAFECATNAEVNGALHADHSVFQGRRKSTLVTVAANARGRALHQAESHEVIECVHTATTTNVSTSVGGATTGGCLDDKVTSVSNNATTTQNGNRLAPRTSL